MGAPGDYGVLCGVVVREVVFGDVDGLALFHVTPVFKGQSVPVILRVAENEELTAFAVFHRVDPRFVGDGEQLKVGNLADILLPDLGVAGLM